MDQRAAQEAPPAVPRLADWPMADSRTAAYGILRDLGPVGLSQSGSYWILSSDAAEFALKHPDMFSSRQSFDAVGSPLPLVSIAFDPPQRTRYRRILHPFFSPKGVASWEPTVRALAGELVDSLAGRGECDLVADLGVPLPAQVFLTLFGLPLSTAFALLAAQPPLRRQIAADPASIPDAVEELLRFDGPFFFISRVTTQDVELAGQLIPAGAHVNIALAVANRDPAEHPEPDTIDLRRQERNLAFGWGPHRCLGSHLARIELRATLAEWHRRIPEYQLAPGVTPRVTWPEGAVSIASLPLVFLPAGTRPARPQE